MQSFYGKALGGGRGGGGEKGGGFNHLVDLVVVFLGTRIFQNGAIQPKMIRSKFQRNHLAETTIFLTEAAIVTLEICHSTVLLLLSGDNIVSYRGPRCKKTKLVAIVTLEICHSMVIFAFMHVVFI